MLSEVSQEVRDGDHTISPKWNLSNKTNKQNRTRGWKRTDSDQRAGG